MAVIIGRRAAETVMKKIYEYFSDISWQLAAFIVICLLVVATTAHYIGEHSAENTEKLVARYPLLADRLFEAQTDDMIINFTQLREVMNQRHLDKKIPLGVYFEYLPSGASIGVNDQLQVEIGSLSKVPAVMAFYKQMEQGAINHDALLTIQKENLDSYFGDLYKRGAGTQLSVKEAIDYTLKKSDNTAASLLVGSLPDKALEAVFNELDLPKTRTGPYPVMSPKSYASVFRSLYLSAYLSEQSSEEILETLTSTDFHDKLPAGVSGTVKVAHKIGVFKVEGAEDIFGDCGIVYEPKRPYILCVMVAADENTARDEIIAYSKMVYSYVSQVKKVK